MGKRILSFLLTLAIITAFLPLSSFEVTAAATQNSRIAISASNVSTIEGNKPYIEVILKKAKIAPSKVAVAVVAAGSGSEDVLAASRFDMSENDDKWTFQFDTAAALSSIGDVNLWFFVDDKEPISDNKCWRVDGNNPTYYFSLRGLNPKRLYASVTETPMGYTLTAYSVIGDTYFEFVKQETGVAATGTRVDIATAGSLTYDIPDLTGGYMLRYTRDGISQDIAYFRLLGGKLPLGISKAVAMKAELGHSGSEGSIDGWSTGEGSPNGRLKAWVSVNNEDFDYPVELYIVNKDTKEETFLAKSMDNGVLDAATIDAQAENPYNWGYNRNVRYFFDITIDTKFADGIYLLRARRGNDYIDIWQYEMFNGQLHGMTSGETPIKPLSVDDSAPANEYCRIFLQDESFVTSTATSYFSLDGGKKWLPLSDMGNYKKRDSKTGQLMSSKVFDKGFELWLSDTAPVSGKMPDSAKLIKFPKVGKRSGAPKLEVNYQLAHMNSDGTLNFDYYDENLWVVVEKGKTVPLGEGYLFYYGGQTENNQGYIKQTGKPDWEFGSYELPSTGIPIPESDEDNGGIMYSETSDKVSYKSIKEYYFVSTVPYIKDGVYYPASKPAKLAVSSYAKPPAMKIDYKKETMKLIAGAVFEDKQIYNGIVSVQTAKSKTEGVVSVTEMLDNDCLEGSYQIAPTAKKPASCPVFWSFAYRGTDIMELDSDSYKDKEVNITEYGKFTPSKALEFRQETEGSWSNWGGFKAPKSAGQEVEYRTKATAKSGKLIFEGEWWMDDSVILKSEDEVEVWAAGEPQAFQYRWGKSYETQNGKAPTKDGVEWTNIG